MNPNSDYESCLNQIIADCLDAKARGEALFGHFRLQNS